MTITINSVDYQISTELLALETPWYDYLLNAGDVSYQLASKYGGYAKPSFGEIELSPALFTVGNWPPPASCAVMIEYTETTEAASEEMFRGSAHLKSFDRNGVRYELHHEEFDSYLDASTAIADDLDDVFTTYTGASYLDLTLNTTYARAVAPAVSYTTTSKQPTVEVLSDIAKFFSHLFYVRGTTLYLVDMLGVNGTPVDITEFDFYPAGYEMNQPYSLLTTDDDSVEGSYPYGSELSVSPTCHGTQANRLTALGNIKTIVERRRATITKPMASSTLPFPGMRFDFLDESTVHDLDVVMLARNMTFNLNDEDVTIEGDFDVVESSPSASPSEGTPSRSESASPSYSPSDSPSASPSGA